MEYFVQIHSVKIDQDRLDFEKNGVVLGSTILRKGKILRRRWFRIIGFVSSTWKTVTSSRRNDWDSRKVWTINETIDEFPIYFNRTRWFSKKTDFSLPDLDCRYSACQSLTVTGYNIRVKQQFHAFISKDSSWSLVHVNSRRRVDEVPFL